jgi:hypothetical protein
VVIDLLAANKNVADRPLNPVKRDL